MPFKHCSTLFVPLTRSLSWAAFTSLGKEIFNSENVHTLVFNSCYSMFLSPEYLLRCVEVGHVLVGGNEVGEEQLVDYV